QRSGIAAGVARTRVGRAQESFERPETALEVERPKPIAETPPTVGEPEVEPDEVATVGIVALDRAEEPVPAVSAQPDLPREEELAAVESTVEDTTVDETTAEAVEPAPIETGPEPTNPIQDAIAAAMNRIPPRDFFPPSVGEESDLGFAGLNRPAEAGRIDVAPAEAKAPPVDRPELAGLAPLQAAPMNLPASLAEAALPPEDLPDVAALGLQAPPSESIGSPSSGPSLPVAQVGAEERPVVQDLPPYSAPGVAALTAGSLAEATVVPPETPASDAVAMASSPVEPIDGLLAEAGVAESERPELADVEPAETPDVPPLEAVLAEAEVAPSESPDSDGVEMVGPPVEAVDPDLAEAAVTGSERPDLVDVGPAETPGVPPLEGVLVEAVMAPSESPDSDGVEMVGPPVEAVDPDLAEAAVTGSERPDLVDVGPAEMPTAQQMEGVLAEAAPEAEERPDDSIAAAEPAPAGEVSGVTFEPEPDEEEILVVEESIEGPVDMFADALLTLEPADFRPPEYPSPDEESLMDRETPAEEPEFVVELETPDATQPAEVVEVVEGSVAETEPVEVAVIPVERADAPARDLPVVSDLVDNNYYLQIGAYTAPATAQVAVDALGATYPMAVLPVDIHGATVYRVLVGPLEQDETGTLLLWLRAKGYRDTFIRSGVEL
ncbi:MAG: SPOR domain-containing protein, partial [Spirochaetia bacterium]